jgi:TatD DNase family protein
LENNNIVQSKKYYLFTDSTDCILTVNKDYMLDTHCHIFDPPLFDNLTNELNLAKKAGLTGIISVSTRINPAKQYIQYHQDVVNILPDSRFALGLHPWFIKEKSPDWLTELENSLDLFQGIGEIGLDRSQRAPDIQIQIEHFQQQLELAVKYDKPAFLHVIRAHNLVLEYLKKMPKARGVIHAFSGSPADARSYTAKGWLLGVGGGITRKNAHRLRRIFKKIPLEHIVLETDSPYMGLQSVDPGQSTPANLELVAKKLAELKNCSLAKIIAITTENANKIFK